ncbi:MAG: DNA polymerase I, partial [Thermotogaceae bacterium]|nr:DNA polymerase I [Thermotogaceae bacterium]
MAKLFLFDGTGLMYRAYFALDRSLSTSKGIPTNAVYGVMKMLIKFLRENVSNDDYVAFVVDVKTTTYRHEILETYKAKRPPTPDTLIEQIPYVKEAVRALGVRVLEYENCEADDVIATLAVKGKDVFDEIYIVTGDKDMLQLVNEKTKVWRTTRGITELELYDKKRIFEKYGLEPSQIVDLLALAGDSSDNVPGVKGIGLKRGTELVKTYGSVENIYKNVSPSTKLGKLLIESKEKAFKSKKVVTLMKNLDLGLQWED